MARAVALGIPYHLTQRGNQGPLEEWSGWLVDGLREEEIYEELWAHARTGRPLGSPGFLEHLEGLLNRVLHRQKDGRKPKKETK